MIPLSGGRYNDKGWCSAIVWKRRSDDNKTPYQVKELEENYLPTAIRNQYGKDIPISGRQPTEASRSIGYRTLVCGGNKKELEHQISEGIKMLRNAQTSNLSTANGIRLYQNVVTPARIYTLLPHQWDKNDIMKIQAAPIKMLLSALQICSTSHRSIMHGPTKYGCCKISRWGTTITATQCSRALKELNGTDRNGMGLHNLINHQQRDMETSKRFLELEHNKWSSFLKTSWITSLLKRCSSYNIEILGGWVHSKQRQHDQHLGDLTINLPQDDRKIIYKKIRTLHITTVADIAAANGIIVHPAIINATKIPNRRTNIIWGKEEHHIRKPMTLKWRGFLCTYTNGHLTYKLNKSMG